MSDNSNGTIILYMHAGSGNHGCEAIANSLSGMIPDNRVLISYFADEDRKYSLGDMYEIFQERSFNSHRIAHVLYYGYRLLTKDKESFIRYRFINRKLTLLGNIVISVGCFGHAGDTFTEEQKVMLDDIHKRKIDMSDAIYVINKDGYIGASTRSEIQYAMRLGKQIIFMEDDLI